MKGERCYKLLGFLTIDYKAYEVYLEALALQGYELVKIGPSMIGHFMKIPPTAIQYYVDLVRDEEMEAEIEDYIELCKESGWKLVGKIGDAKIFKAIKDTEPIPIHTDKEIEAKHIIGTVRRREGWFTFFIPFWFMLGVGNLLMMDYRDLLDNIAIATIFTQMGIAFIYGLRTSYLLYFICKLKMKVKNKSEMKYSVFAAKVRRNIDYFIMAFFFGFILFSLGGLDISMWFGVISIMSFILLLIITMEKYHNRRISSRTKFAYTVAVIATFLITVYIGIPMALNGTDKDRESLETAKTTIEQTRPLSLKDFPLFKNAVIDDFSIDKGSSIVVEHYYEYWEYLIRDGSLDANYYKLRNEKMADIFWNSILKENTDDYRAVEKVASQPHDVDEAYYNENYKILLLRKGNEVVYLQTHDLDVWSPENAEVIKGIFK